MELRKLATYSKLGRVFGVLSAVLCMAPVASAAGLGARHYVQEGLVTHFDAIENTGYDEPHDGSASIWSDLKGSASITLKTEASWSGRYLDTGRKEHVVTSMPAYKRNLLTLELPMRVVKNNGQSNTFPMLFCDNGQKFYAYYWYAQTWGYLGMDSTLTIDYFKTGSFYAFSNEAKWGWGYNATQKNATSGPVTANIEHSAGDWYINSGTIWTVTTTDFASTTGL